MCSACAGDDPRPESFANFDGSSPKSSQDFALEALGERNRYGTTEKPLRGATILGFIRDSARTWFLRPGLGTQQQGIVNLRALGFVQVGPGMRIDTLLAKFASQNALQAAGGPIEVRVTRDTICEVYGPMGTSEGILDPVEEGSVAGENEHEERSELARAAGCEWEASSAARQESRDATAEYRRMRRIRAAIAYAGVVAFVAFAAWYAMR